MQADFPYLALAQTAQFYLVGQSLDPEQGITGVETIVPVPRGRWVASASFVLSGEAARLQWEAFLARMEGRIGTTLVPARTRLRPRDRFGRALSGAPAGVPDRNGVIPPAFPPRVTVASAAVLRQRWLDVVYEDTTGILPGHSFSVGDRLHKVQAVQALGGVHRISFNPPLRAAVAAGAAVEIDRPVCRMRFTTETEGLFDQALSELPAVNVNFVEAI
ncbi:hypothetical protein [Falsirhodobacter sp. 20TX0035]|uniref:hypothetical protein n=1 Tax=Falsirhodobacter sp. 20TX0035 TaxID=3022019 RepID=UPI00232B0B8C|nr:hypothetical protein [Falsirhodobacter sp. 20TX0035]MDB6455030.1 hypothetical protein [Falsirhodobacter sp. 20TX0035]